MKYIDFIPLTIVSDSYAQDIKEYLAASNIIKSDLISLSKDNAKAVKLKTSCLIRIHLK